MDFCKGILDDHRKVQCRAVGEWNTSHHHQGDTCDSGHSQNQQGESRIDALQKHDPKRIPHRTLHNQEIGLEIQCHTHRLSSHWSLGMWSCSQLCEHQQYVGSLHFHWWMWSHRASTDTGLENQTLSLKVRLNLLRALEEILPFAHPKERLGGNCHKRCSSFFQARGVRYCCHLTMCECLYSPHDVFKLFFYHWNRYNQTHSI